MRRFNYLLNDLAFYTLVIKCLYGEPNDEEVKECENQIELLKQEKQQLKQALLDINEYIETNSYFKDNIVKTMVLEDYSKCILNIVNKALGSDK